MTDLRKAAEMALVALDSTARSAVEQYVIEQQVVTFLKQALAQNPLDIADRAYFAGKQAGIEEALAQPEQTTIESVYETIVRWDEGGGKRSRRELARRIADNYTTPPSRQEPVMKVQYFGDTPVYILLRPISDGTKLYTAPPSRPDLSQEMVEALQQWANGEKFVDQEELDNARLSRNVILAKIKEQE